MLVGLRDLRATSATSALKILPMRGGKKELGTGLVRKIKRDLGLE
jgi:hypothetical protein